MIRVALVGAGGHSLGNHAPALQRYAAQHTGDVQLAAVCDLDATKAKDTAARFGFQGSCTRLDDLARPGVGPVDAVVAILPIPAMASVTPQLLALDRPLLIEKPLGQDLSEARALVRRIEQAGAVDRVVVSLNRRFDPGLTRGLEWIRQQGPVRYVRGCMIRSGRLEPDFIWGTGIHIIDALACVAGPLRVEHQHCPGRGMTDTWRVARLRGRDDVTVDLAIFPDGGEWEESIRIAGNGYHVDIHSGTCPPWRVRAVRGLTLALDERSPADEPPCVANGTYGETEAFLDAVRLHRSMPAPSVHDALASSEVATQLQMSR